MSFLSAVSCSVKRRKLFHPFKESKLTTPSVVTEEERGNDMNRGGVAGVGMLVLKIGGRWEVGPQNTWELGG